MRGSSHTGAPF